MSDSESNPSEAGSHSLSRSEASDNLSEGRTSPAPPRSGLHFLTPPRSEGRRSFTSQRSQLLFEPFSPLRRPGDFAGNFAANLEIPPFNPPTSGSPQITPISTPPVTSTGNILSTPPPQSQPQTQPPPFTMATNTIVNVNAHRSIAKFSGLPSGVSVGTFIQQLEQYFSTQGITDDARKINECKQSLDPNQGEAFNMATNMSEFVSATTWADFSNKLRSFFTPPSQKTVMAGLSELLDATWSEKETAYGYVTRMERIAAGITAADRIQHVNNFDVSAGFLRRIITAKLHNALTDKGRTKMEKNLDGNDTAATIYQRTSAGMLDNQAYRRGNRKDNSAQCRAATTNWASTTPKQATGGSTRPKTGPPKPEQKPKATSKPPGKSKDQECYKCRKKGHYSPDCRSKPFCNKCKVEGHRNDGRGKCLYLPEDGHQKPSGGGGNQRDPPRNPQRPDRSAAIRVLAGLLQECGAKKSDLGF